MNTTSSVLVGSQGQTVWVKVRGRGTFQNSPGVKDFVRKMIQRGNRDFIVDLGECELMDSTFMGTLAGVALRLREIGQGSLRTINVNPRNSSLLENLGLDHLFSVENDSEVATPTSLREADRPPGSDVQKEAVLSAHEALVEADSHNAVKFKDVIDYLRQELGEDTHEEG